MKIFRAWMFKIDVDKQLTIVNQNKAIVEDSDGIVHEIKEIGQLVLKYFKKVLNMNLFMIL